MTKRYYLWDYDAGIVSEWQRLGECSQCGECCRIRLGYTVCRENGKPCTTDGKGKWGEVAEGEERLFFRFQNAGAREQCDRLLGNTCSVHGDDEARSDLCKEWPICPLELVPFPDCGYSFERVSEWRI